MLCPSVGSVTPVTSTLRLDANSQGGDSVTQMYNVPDNDVVETGPDPTFIVEARIQQTAVALFDVGADDGQATDSATLTVVDDDG